MSIGGVGRCPLPESFSIPLPPRRARRRQPLSALQALRTSSVSLASRTPQRPPVAMIPSPRPLPRRRLTLPKKPSSFASLCRARPPPAFARAVTPPPPLLLLLAPPPDSPSGELFDR